VFSVVKISQRKQDVIARRSEATTKQNDRRKVMSHQKRILILDDERILREILARELQHEGYDALPLECKRHAYDLLTEWRPDMIISDINSPTMNGWQFLKWVRANPFASRVGFIFLTGFADLKNALRAKQLGANDFVSKPYDLSDLLVTIRREFAQQEEPVWELPASFDERVVRGPLYALAWPPLVRRWKSALIHSPYRTGILGMSAWKLDFVVDDGNSLTVGRLCRPPDPTIRYSACRYHSFVDGYGADNGLIYLLGPQTNHLQTSPRAIIAPAGEMEEIFAGGIFAPDLKRFET
jgi:CheY-like chemotaxis protein